MNHKEVLKQDKQEVGILVADKSEVDNRLIESVVTLVYFLEVALSIVLLDEYLWPPACLPLAVISFILIR